MEAIKFEPEDFVVQEVLDPPFGQEGPYSYYLLRKRGKGTLDVIQQLVELFKLPRAHFGFAGLKDRRAVTVQYISILDGPERDVKGEGFELTFLGKASVPIRIGDAKGNLFTVRLRGVDPEAVKACLKKDEAIGFPNYFGEQRFAGEKCTERPIAAYLIKGDYQGALKEYLCHHPEAEVRTRLRRLWENPSRFLKEAAPLLSKIDLIALKVYLKKKDPHRALRALPKQLKLLFMFSYQAFLWNEVLSRVIRKRADKVFHLPFIRGQKLCFYLDANEGIKDLYGFDLPYISAEALELNMPEDVRREFEQVLEDETKALGLKDPYELLNAQALSLRVFSTGKRKAVVFPEGVKFLEKTRDAIKVQFFLPSGSYATVLLRKVVAQAAKSAPLEADGL